MSSFCMRNLSTWNSGRKLFVARKVTMIFRKTRVPWSLPTDIKTPVGNSANARGVIGRMHDRGLFDWLKCEVDSDSSDPICYHNTLKKPRYISGINDSMVLIRCAPLFISEGIGIVNIVCRFDVSSKATWSSSDGILYFVAIIQRYMPRYTYRNYRYRFQ